MILRAALDDASDYQQNRSAYERGDWREYSVSTADLDALQSVLDRSTPMLFNVNRASDISVILGLVDEYSIRAIDVAVILDGMNNLPGDFDHINARLDSASILVDAGVTVAFGAGARTHNARNLTQSAGIAVANGLEWDAALATITLAPAQIYGVDGLVGSIEAGKEADLVFRASPYQCKAGKHCCVTATCERIRTSRRHFATSPNLLSINSRSGQYWPVDPGEDGKCQAPAGSCQFDHSQVVNCIPWAHYPDANRGQQDHVGDYGES